MRSTPLMADRVPSASPAAAAGMIARTARIGFAAIYAAPAVLAGRCVFYGVLMLVLTTFWDKVARAPSPHALSHVPAAGLALYIGVTEWLTLGTPAIHLRLEDDIRSGALEALLLRPKSHLLLRLGENMGAMLARMAALGVAGLALLVLSGRPWPLPATFAGLLVLALLGGVVGLLSLALVGLTAFWLRRTLPIYLVNQKASFLLGGLVAPITLYPHWLERIGALSPYAAQLYWPAAFAMNPSWSRFAEALGSQALWIVAGGLAVLWLWTLGLRKVLREGC